MWSLSTLIKLTVVPNCNQKDTTSMPDSAGKTCTLVCVCRWEKIERERELITIFTSNFTLSRHSVEESAKAPEEQQGKKQIEMWKRRQRGIYSRQYIQMVAWWGGKREFSGFRNQDKESEECRRIVINSELFYLWGIRGINRGFGLDSAPFTLFQHGSLVPVCKRVVVCACVCVFAYVCVCVCFTCILKGTHSMTPAAIHYLWCLVYNIFALSRGVVCMWHINQQINTCLDGLHSARPSGWVIYCAYVSFSLQHICIFQAKFLTKIHFGQGIK